MKAFVEYEAQERAINGDTPTPPYENPAVEAYVKPIRRMDTGARHEIVLLDVRGQVRQHAMGTSRDACIAGLRAHGFTIQDLTI